MASISKRKEQVNELRKAHFPFGFENNQGARSEYKQEYNQYPVEAPQNHGDRSSHFTIASDEPAMAKNTYQSEFKEKYPQHPLAHKQTVKKSNDENNIVLGFGGQQPLTNYRDQYSQKAAEKVIPVNQRVVNVDLGDTLTDFTTSYHKAYDGSQGGRPDRLTAAQGSIVLGYDPNAYTTSNAASHNPKPVPNAKAPARNYATNIVLGGDGPHFHSEHKSQFAHKDSAKESVDKQRVLDFKSAHFKFGFPEQTEANISQAQAHYSEKPLTIVPAEGAKPTNIELKHDGNNYFTSSYGQDFQLKKGEKAELLNKNGRNSSVVIGMGTETYQTEAKDQFVAKAVDRVRGKGTEGSLELGGGERTFETQYQNTFTNKFDQREGNRVSKADIDKMRAENFVKGFSGPDYQLHSQSYGQQGGQGAKLPRQVIDKMRGTNIVHSDNTAFHGNTTHKLSYSWKRNDDF